jgi:3-aminobutyryl-CoA ammonia-lyase
MSEEVTSTLRIRLSAGDAHYAAGLIAGAKLMEIFGDLATEICIRTDGDEGLLRAYSEVEFLAPVYAGDFLEARAVLRGRGRTSRTIEFEAYKVVGAEEGTGCARVMEKPVLVAKAKGTVVVPEERQTKVQG